MYQDKQCILKLQIDSISLQANGQEDGKTLPEHVLMKRLHQTLPYTNLFHYILNVFTASTELHALTGGGSLPQHTGYT
jgi:hypothetical protein